MFPDLSPRAKAVTYAVLVMALCFAVSFAMRAQGEAAAVVAMLTPLTAVVLMQTVVTRDGRTRAGWRGLGAGRAGFALWPIAIGLPIAALAGAEGVLRVAGLTGVDTATLPGLADLPDFAIQLVVVGMFCFAEEIGWRGYLLPLVQRDGRRFAAARVGFLHGLFHLPIAFVVPGAYLTDGPRWLTVPLFLGVLTTAGVLYGWMRDRSGSVWPAVVSHTAFNVALNVFADAFPARDVDTVALVGRETGIATLGLLVLSAAFVTVSANRAPAPPSAEPAPEVLTLR
jgi:membrane protease YdiL (CAAX protease family)